MDTSVPQNGVKNRRGLEEKTSLPPALETQQRRAADSTSSVTPSPSSHWTLLVVFVCLLVDLLGFTVILPLIPSMLEYYSKKDQVSK